MGTVHCPLCGLRFRHSTELVQHAREDHAPPPAAEVRDHISVPHRPRAEEMERPIDQVLRPRPRR
jgi:hypothetical protein